jgi:hypothetical protein
MSRPAARSRTTLSVPLAGQYHMVHLTEQQRDTLEWPQVQATKGQPSRRGAVCS